jgi:hypothetical protein
MTAWTDERRKPSATLLTDAATVTPNCNITDLGVLLSLSQATTIANPLGTPIDGQSLTLRIKSTTSQTLIFGSAYLAASSSLLPATTTGGGVEDVIKFVFSRNLNAWVLWFTSFAGGSSILKKSDELRTNTVGQTNDADLFFPVLADTFYRYELHLLVTGVAATGGFTFRTALPAGAFSNWNARSSASSAIANNISNTTGTIISAAAMLATQSVFVFGQIRTAATAGTINMSWSQATASLNSTVLKAGSKLLWWKI